MSDYDGEEDYPDNSSIASEGSVHTVQSGKLGKPGLNEDSDEEDRDKDVEDDDESVVEEDKTEKLVKKPGSKIIDGPTSGTLSPYMTKFEYARLLAVRATAIESGKPTTICETLEIDAISIAKEEILLGKCPLFIYRERGTVTEKWYRVKKLDGSFTMKLPFI
jgi:DNA-directed RNA polymerase subunit K/omega